MRHVSKLIVRDSCLMLEARRVRSNARITNSLCYGNLKGNGNSKGNTDSQNTGQGGSCHVPWRCPRESRTEHPYKFASSPTCKRSHPHSEATP